MSGSPHDASEKGGAGPSKRIRVGIRGNTYMRACTGAYDITRFRLCGEESRVLERIVKNDEPYSGTDADRAAYDRLQTAIRERGFKEVESTGAHQLDSNRELRIASNHHNRERKVPAIDLLD